jgi:hypothetical protein
MKNKLISFFNTSLGRITAFSIVALAVDFVVVTVLLMLFFQFVSNVVVGQNPQLDGPELVPYVLSVVMILAILFTPFVSYSLLLGISSLVKRKNYHTTLKERLIGFVGVFSLILFLYLFISAVYMLRFNQFGGFLLYCLGLSLVVGLWFLLAVFSIEGLKKLGLNIIHRFHKSKSQHKE